MRFLLRLLFVVAVVIAAGLWITRPGTVDTAALSALNPDAERGAVMFTAMGCASCHVAPDSENKLVLAGGQTFVSEFGTFVAPNISSHPEYGIGDWSDEDIANAVLMGTSPEGAHYYPAFPYTSYGRSSLQDVVDLAAYLRTLPADATPSQPHDLAFPFNIRLILGGWKFLFLDTEWVMPDTVATTPELVLGRTLVEGWGHCAECHTPRTALGGLKTDAWLAGGPNPSGEGNIPSLRPADLFWSAGDISAYLDSGFTPEFDSAGGEMVAVIENTKQLPPAHRNAIAAYLLALED